MSNGGPCLRIKKTNNNLFYIQILAIRYNLNLVKFLGLTGRYNLQQCYPAMKLCSLATTSFHFKKHSGLILVPWFNSEEWRYVYNCIYQNDKESQFEALELLKIWKARNPVLSSSVEGTLILLDALLIDSEDLSAETLSQLYSIALMRFLNLSAANSEKQGSFAKTSSKNELPKWLVNLRHDIAHGHQIPSLFNLKMGLEFGLAWLKEKYWEPQHKIIKDYYIDATATADKHLADALKAFCDANVALYENLDVDSEYLENIKNAVNKKFKKNASHPYFMLDILLEIISEYLRQITDPNNVWLDILLSTEALLKSKFQTSKEGTETLDKDFRNVWQRLLNLFHQHGYTFILLNKLFDIIVDMQYCNFIENTRKMAAFWINEILMALITSENTEGIITLETSTKCYVEEAKQFQDRVIYSNSEHLKYFLDSLLKFNETEEAFAQDVFHLIKAKSDTENPHVGVENIYTLEDLNLVDSNLVDDLDNSETVESQGINSSRIITSTNKWRKIEDTTMFRGCPLGVLPHQIGQKHPFIPIS